MGWSSRSTPRSQNGSAVRSIRRTPAGDERNEEKKAPVFQQREGLVTTDPDEEVE